MMKRLALMLSLLALGLALPSAPADAAEAACPVWRQTTYTVGTSSTALAGTAGAYLPTGGRLNSLGQLGGRRYLTVCQSKATTSTTAQTTLRVDGFVPVSYPDAGALDGGPTPGPDLAWGDCISYPVPDSIVPRAISSEAGSKVSVFECGGTP